MGAYLEKNGKTPQRAATTRIVLAAYEKDVPIFCPAFSDCSAGFGLVAHQHARQGKPKVSIDSAKDFYELTQLKIANPTTGLLMIGGGVPKNFAQDIVVAADILGVEAPDAQVRHPDHGRRRPRRRALRSSTLKEASSWGKVDTHLRADGLHRSDDRAAADRRLRLAQTGIHRASRAPLGAPARARHGLIYRPVTALFSRNGPSSPDGPFAFRHLIRYLHLSRLRTLYISYAL